MEQHALSDLIFVYIWLRARRAKRKAEYSESDASDKAMQETIEAELLAYMNESGVESVKGELGTAYKSTKIAAIVNDWNTLIDFVKENEMWDLLEQRVNRGVVEQFIADHGKSPPGVSVLPGAVVNVRRN